MNKTININLAGIFFHIDEDAYQKLQHYLTAVKASFAGTPGAEEINADIEARIAELFNENLKSDRQVVGMKEVEEVIAIMGQPEDYRVDEEIFDDAEDGSERPQSVKNKKLYRDPDSAYISGVSGGLAHYLGIEAVWVRLLWIILTLGTSGAMVLIYLALWIFVPEARTTAEKLEMRGEPINISNIERKIKEGFDDVSQRVKDVDYEKYGYKVRKGAKSAAGGISHGVKVLLNIFVKLIGILILLVAGSTLIGLFFGGVTLIFFGISQTPWTDFFSEIPLDPDFFWIASLLTLIVTTIPFFFLFILGLKILMPRVKSTGRTPNLVLFGLWIISLLGLIFIGIQQATASAFDSQVAERSSLPLQAGDTLYISMQGNDDFEPSPFRNGDVLREVDSTGLEIFYSDRVRWVLRHAKEPQGQIVIHKKAEGRSNSDARKRAETISYSTTLTGNELKLDGFLSFPADQKLRNQEVVVYIHLPQGVIVRAADHTHSFHRNSEWYNDILRSGDEGKYMLITETGTQCLDCPPAQEDSAEEESSEIKQVEDSLDTIEEEDPWAEPYRSSGDQSV